MAERYSRKRVVATNVAVGVAYAGIGYATLALDQASGLELRRVLWLSSGIALAVALKVPFEVWLGVGLGAVVATSLDRSPLGHIAATGVANGLEIGLSVHLLRRFGFDPAIAKVRDVVLFVVLACGLSSATAALISVTSLVLTGGAPATAFGRIWYMWWLTHAIGMLVVVPPALIFRPRGPTPARASLPGVAVVLPLVAATAWISFLAPPDTLAADLFFLPFPLIVWGAVRGDALGAALGGLVVTIAAVVGAILMRGPFASGSAQHVLFLTWCYSSVTIIAAAITAAVVSERATAQRGVESGERRLRAVLDATSEGILVANGDGRVTDVNSAFLGLIGASPAEEVIGARAASLLERLHVRRDPGGAERRVLDASGTFTGRHKGELHLTSARFVEAESAPLTGVPGRVWSMRDITERVESEEERRRLHEQILHSQKLEGLGVLAGGIAHDFNNLLAGIMGYADLLLTQEGLNPQGTSDVKGIIKASTHAAGLCRQLLTYAGKTTTVLAPTDVCACAEDMRQLLQISVSKRADLSLDLPPEPVFALADGVQLRQVLLNLVTNASEAVQDGSGQGRISVRVGRRFCDREWLDQAVVAEELSEGEYAIIEVEDDGVGMHEEMVGRIFDPFFSSKGPGRGLGLAATLGVLRSHSGGLVVESTAGVGSRFSLALPCASSPASARAPAVEARPAGSPKTVLVVDDEAMVRRTVSRMIRRMGYEVLEASDGDGALEVIAQRLGEIDLILLDLTMPGRDGLGTLEAMREQGHDIPVLLASGYSSEAVPASVAVAGFIQKPFRSAVLVATIAEVLGATQMASD